MKLYRPLRHSTRDKTKLTELGTSYTWNCIYILQEKQSIQNTVHLHKEFD